MARASGTPCIYRVTSQHNTLIREGDFFKGRLLDTDWVVFVGQATYMLLSVQGRYVTGKPDYPCFHAKPLGKPIRWALLPREISYLQSGETLEAPMELDRFLDDVPEVMATGSQRERMHAARTLKNSDPSESSVG